MGKTAVKLGVSWEQYVAWQIGGEKKLFLSVYLHKNLRRLPIPIQTAVEKLNQNPTKVPNLPSFYDLHVMEKPKQEERNLNFQREKKKKII